MKMQMREKVRSWIALRSKQVLCDRGLTKQPKQPHDVFVLCVQNYLTLSIIPGFLYVSVKFKRSSEDISKSIWALGQYHFTLEPTASF